MQRAISELLVDSVQLYTPTTTKQTLRHALHRRSSPKAEKAEELKSWLAALEGRREWVLGGGD